MHPFMALWIWSMTMSRVARDAVLQSPFLPNDTERSSAGRSFAPIAVHAGDYLQSDVTRVPLPGPLLDRLADLYWTERDTHLAI